MINRSRVICSIIMLAAAVCSVQVPRNANADVVVGGSELYCHQDSQCFNRLHPDIPFAARAKAGESVKFIGRDNMGRNAEALADALRNSEEAVKSFPKQIGQLHALIGPVFIDGAHPGDVLAVTIQNIAPAPIGYTHSSSWGFAGDLIEGEKIFVWELNEEFAVSDDLPGIKIPNASFPGIITTLPGEDEIQAILERESELLEAGGWVFVPDPELAHPAELCGPQGTKRDECVRTVPPREHGGNMDIRYLGKGVTVYLPCYIEGCGLALGDFHYAQGDGEVAGTGIEMPADVTVTTQIIKEGPDLSRGPHYEGSAKLLDIPSTRFYAVTGFPLKEAGTIPREMEYLDSPKVARLKNLSRDINLASRNALAAMIDHIVAEYGYSRLQAYTIAGVAVDLRIGELVDVPNVAVTAVLPLDIFEEPDQKSWR